MVIHRRIEWVDTDMAGRWHFLTALRLFEAGETALWEQLGGVEMLGDIPRVHVEVDFRRPLHHRDRVEVEVRVDKVGGSSLTFGFDVRRNGTVCAEGAVVLVVVAQDGNVGRIPDEMRERLLTAGLLPPDFVPFADGGAQEAEK